MRRPGRGSSQYLRAARGCRPRKLRIPSSSDGCWPMKFQISPNDAQIRPGSSQYRRTVLDVGQRSCGYLWPVPGVGLGNSQYGQREGGNGWGYREYRRPKRVTMTGCPEHWRVRLSRVPAIRLTAPAASRRDSVTGSARAALGTLETNHDSEQMRQHPRGVQQLRGAPVVSEPRKAASVGTDQSKACSARTAFSLCASSLAQVVRLTRVDAGARCSRQRALLPGEPHSASSDGMKRNTACRLESREQWSCEGRPDSSAWHALCINRVNSTERRSSKTGPVPKKAK